MKPYLRAIFLLFLILPSARWGEAKIDRKTITMFWGKVKDATIKNFPSRDERKKLREYYEKFREFMDRVEQKTTPPHRQCTVTIHNIPTKTHTLTIKQNDFIP